MEERLLCKGVRVAEGVVCTKVESQSRKAEEVARIYSPTSVDSAILTDREQRDSETN